MNKKNTSTNVHLKPVVHLGEYNFKVVDISIVDEFVEVLNSSKRGDFAEDSCFKTFECFGVISTNKKLVT